MTALAKTLHADVVLALDERSARQVSSEIEGHIGDSANRSGDAFNRTLGSKIAGGARDAGQSAGRELRAGITSGIDDAVRQYTSSLGVIGNAGNAAFHDSFQRGHGCARRRWHRCRSCRGRQV